VSFAQGVALSFVGLGFQPENNSIKLALPSACGRQLNHADGIERGRNRR